VLYIEEKYLKLLSNQLTGFTQKSDTLYNCRCPLCGDSKKKKNLKRGYFHQNSGKLFYKCHNCGASHHFGTLLKTLDVNLHREYRLEMFKASSNYTPSRKYVSKVPDATKFIPDIFSGLPKISRLSDDHYAKIWTDRRMIPYDKVDIRFAENFVDWTHGNTTKFKSWKGDDHARIVMPWRDRNDKIIGYSARAFDSNQARKYYRIFVDDQVKERFYGFDRLNFNRNIFVVEGEIDSMMIDNCIAVSNGLLSTYLNRNAIYVPDIDVRNPQIMKNVLGLINLGLKVCMLPDNLGGKDLNELTCSGMKRLELKQLIKEHTFSGIRATLEYNLWRKC